MSANEYTPTIGIETHVQLNTKTKLFAAVGNDAREASPNTLISHICVGLPGALPVLNEAAIELCTKAAIALGTQPQKTSFFERKHYFYPDLPKGYQITQYKAPIIAGGHLHINVDGQRKCIKIQRANLEEDAGKNTHPNGADYTLVDLNRAGTPLLEIVSQADLHSPAEAKAYARELWLTMKYAGVTDGDLYHGHVRFDINVSLSDNSEKLGTRSEIKNLNSFRSVEAGVDYEIKRQIELLKNGEKVVQETRGWDEVKQKTTPQRGKEEAEDYRYMPEPDIPPLELDSNFVDKVKQAMPRLPAMIRRQLSEIGTESHIVEDILDRPEFVPLLLSVLEKAGPETARRAAFWLLQFGADGVKADEVITLSAMIDDGKLNSSAAKTVFEEMQKSKDGPEAIAKQLKLVQVSDEIAIEKIVTEVLAENPKVVTDVKAGQEKAIGFLVGQVMAKSQGQANPGLAQKLIKKQLNV